MCIYICMNLRVYVCMHVCMYVYTYVCIYICIRIRIYVIMYLRAMGCILSLPPSLPPSDDSGTRTQVRVYACVRVRAYARCVRGNLQRK